MTVRIKAFSKRPVVKARVSPRFPVRIIGTGGMAFDYSFGTLAFRFDFGSLVYAAPAAAGNRYQVMIWDSLTGSYARIGSNDLSQSVLGALPTTLPDQSGIWWNNGGAISIS